MEKSSVKILLLRRQHLLILAALVLAGGIFWMVSMPLAVSATASQRQLPIYSVERNEKVCAISFDAAWGNEDTQTLIDILGRIDECIFILWRW